MATSTPWGMSQSQQRLARGIIFYSTPSHGGIHVSKKLNEKIHPAWRIESGWYEEDVDYNIVHYHFPLIERPNRATDDSIRRVLKNYRPHEYMEVTGEKVRLRESYKLREEAFYEDTKNDWVCISAFMSSEPNMVEVTCTIGGRGPDWQICNPETETTFLIPYQEYDTRGRLPYTMTIADSAQYETVKRIKG